MSAPDEDTLREWLATRIPGDLRALQLGEDWNRVTMVSRINTRASTLDTVAHIQHQDAVEALATACLFAVAPALAEEVLRVRSQRDEMLARAEKAEAERDAQRAAMQKFLTAQDAFEKARREGEHPDRFGLLFRRYHSARERLRALVGEGGR
jgi:hypothetical protein